MLLRMSRERDDALDPGPDGPCLKVFISMYECWQHTWLTPDREDRRVCRISGEYRSVSAEEITAFAVTRVTQ
ncbi:hypothetical protein TNCV_463351 [Trichonephila clavipes]|nr:hypothetical protein TNCV_463351 [Trichonephila clavipes]